MKAPGFMAYGFASLAAGAGLSVWFGLLGCARESFDYQPQWFTGNQFRYRMDMSLQASWNGAPPQPWAKQSLTLRVTVDSLGDSGSAYMRLNLDSVAWTSEDRDSLETFYMVARLRQYQARFQMMASGELRNWMEEPTLPSLSPSWLQPSRLFSWVWPFWQSVEQPSPKVWVTRQGFPEGDCLWEREGRFEPEARDTSLWTLQVSLKPQGTGITDAPTEAALQSPNHSLCPEPAWTAEGQIIGIRQGLGLQELSWDMQAKVNFGHAPLNSSKSGEMLLKRRLSLRRLP